LCAFCEVAANGEIGGRRTGAIALLEGAIAAVETCDHLFMALTARGFGVDQHLRLVAPFLPLVRAANSAQEMQRAEDLGEPLQVVVERHRPILWRLRLGFVLRLRLLRNRPRCRAVVALLRLLAPTLATPTALALAPRPLLAPKTLAVSRNSNG